MGPDLECGRYAKVTFHWGKKKRFPLSHQVLIEEKLLVMVELCVYFTFSVLGPHLA